MSNAYVVLFVWLIAKPSLAQFSYLVQFPVISSLKDQPHVSCSNLDYSQSPPIQYLPQTGSDAQTGFLIGSCRACTPDNLCVNQFTITTVAYDAFTGLNTPVTTCNPVDVNGNAVNLNDNVYVINMQSKAPTYAASSGNFIADLGKSTQCNQGTWTVTYTTTIAGQYQLNIGLAAGVPGTTGYIVSPLQGIALTKQGSSIIQTQSTSPFEGSMTLLVAGDPTNTYFVDTVVSFRIPCNSGNVGYPQCSYCLNQKINGGCPGNLKIPQAMTASKLFVQAADDFYNAATDFCASDQLMIPGLRSLKILTVQLINCKGSTCLDAVYSPLTASFQAQLQLPVRCICSPSDTCDAVTSPYVINFLASLSGFYRLDITGAGSPVGPIVIPVLAGAIDAAQTLTYGQGLFDAFATQQTIFYVQPRDSFGNYDSTGLHVFQVSISGVNLYYQQDITPIDSGKGYAIVPLILENAGIYNIYVRFCPDLVKYPPYSASDNRLCNLNTPGNVGVNIAGSPFKKTITTPFFDLIGADLPRIVSWFGKAEAGTQIFAIFTEITEKFITCGETYGSPPINSRYLPVIRMDIVGMTYTSSSPSIILTENDVSQADVEEGRFALTRYAEYAGSCLLGGYVMGFLITVSGNYKVWVYTDTVSPRLVTGSVSTLQVTPQPAVLENYRATGAGLYCVLETECMANTPTTFLIQAKDVFMNDAVSCTETLTVYVTPKFAGADHFVVENLISATNIGGVPINGVPGRGVDSDTLSGYVGMPILGFPGDVGDCLAGAYTVSFLATLSAHYEVGITVNGSAVYGSPFAIQVFNQILPITLGANIIGLVTQTRWTYYQVYFDYANVGFLVEVSKTDSSNLGQPWTFLRYNELWSDLQEPEDTAGIRYTYPDVRGVEYCNICRIHVPPSAGFAGLWYVAVYGYQDNSYYSIRVEQSLDTTLQPNIQNAQFATVEAGHYSYHHFGIASQNGFQVRVVAQTSNGGSLSVSIKQGSYPENDHDFSSVFGVALRMIQCTECFIDHPPSPDAPGEWYVSILGITQPVTYQIVLIDFQQQSIDFGQQTTEFAQLSYSWGYYMFNIDPYTDPDGVQVQVIPEDASDNLTTVLKQAEPPMSLSDSTFRTPQCTHCRMTVFTRTNLQTTWYIGIYTGASGGTFRIRIRLYQSCPNQCFGNGLCVQQKIKVCVCFPGYTGVDCGQAVSSKIFAWFPLDADAIDVSGNQVPLFYKLNSGSELNFLNNAIVLFNTYIIIPKPTPAVACAPVIGLQAIKNPKVYQWGAEIKIHEGTAPGNTVDAQIPEVGPWYQWNEIGNKVGNPRNDMTCAEYNPRRELTVMFWFNFQLPLPSPGSFMGLGSESTKLGRGDVNDNGKWSWMIYPRYHPNGVNIVVDLLLRNATHEISVREHEIYVIDGEDLFTEKGDQLTRLFPNWCIDRVTATATGECKFFSPNEWYYLAVVFGPRRAQLWVGDVMVANMTLDLWNLTDVAQGRIHVGHDPRYAFYERLFFGQMQDIRILRYAASPIEITTAFLLGQTWLANRAAQRSATGLETSNAGSWDDPLPLSSVDDGTLDRDAEPHEDICRQHRAANEPSTYVNAVNCPFQDTDTAWMLKNNYDHGYRKYDTDRTPYGLGFEQMILKDTRPLPPVSLDSFYDYSIDPD